MLSGKTGGIDAAEDGLEYGPMLTKESILVRRAHDVLGISVTPSVEGQQAENKQKRRRLEKTMEHAGIEHCDEDALATPPEQCVETGHGKRDGFI